MTPIASQVAWVTTPFATRLGPRLGPRGAHCADAADLPSKKGFKMIHPAMELLHELRSSSPAHQPYSRPPPAPSLISPTRRVTNDWRAPFAGREKANLFAVIYQPDDEGEKGMEIRQDMRISKQLVQNTK